MVWSRLPDQMCARLGVVGLLCLAAGCSTRSATQDASAGDTKIVDPCPPCTDPKTCCKDEDLKCYGGGGEGGIVCTCSAVWDCPEPQRSCTQDLPTPDVQKDWTCIWSSTSYRCSAAGQSDQLPDGGDKWTCSFDGKTGVWSCTRTFPPTPCDKPVGVDHWRCEVSTQVSKHKLLCLRTTPIPPPVGAGTWDCRQDRCQKLDEDGGLPSGGSGWRCHSVTREGRRVWICVGSAEGSPGGQGWSCTKMQTGYAGSLVSCSRDEIAGDYPTSGGYWACMKGSAFGGTRCVQVGSWPEPPSVTPNPAETCEPNERRWCEGLTHGGWGQVVCDGSGRWKTTNQAGKTVLDCQEATAGGEVPDTLCACYHRSFSAGCCQRPDCIVPGGTGGQSCPPSTGGLCDPCTPAKPECKDPKAQCIVTNSDETFCGSDCAVAGCPGDYRCMSVKLQVGMTKQCVPSDFSCYY